MKKEYKKPLFMVRLLKTDVMTESVYKPLDSIGDDSHDYGGEWKW